MEYWNTRLMSWSLKKKSAGVKAEFQLPMEIAFGRIWRFFNNGRNRTEYMFIFHQVWKTMLTKVWHRHKICNIHHWCIWKTEWVVLEIQSLGVINISLLESPLLSRGWTLNSLNFQMPLLLISSSLLFLINVRNKNNNVWSGPFINPPDKWNALLIFFLGLMLLFGCEGGREGGRMGKKGKGEEAVLPGEGLALNVLIKLRSIAIQIGLTWLTVACFNKKSDEEEEGKEKQDFTLELYLNFLTQSDKNLLLRGGN